MLARLCRDAEYRTTARACLRVWVHARVVMLIALVSLCSCLQACTIIARRLTKRQLAPPYTPSPLGCAAMMDCHGHLPRLAFGHLDQDACVEEGGAVDVVVTAAYEAQPCSIALERRISSALSVPGSNDQTLLPQKSQRGGAKRRLWTRRRQ